LNVTFMPYADSLGVCLVRGFVLAIHSPRF
jgi:hypothetical protein